MKKIILLSLFLVFGLLLSQFYPSLLSAGACTALSASCSALLSVCLGYIMINVGREFEIDKSNLRSYAVDYVVAMITAAMPWLLVCVYFVFELMPPALWGSWDAWKELLLLSRFAAPTSAGILFTMLIAAGLKTKWIYKKIQVLAIFDDLDTILLMIPLQIFMVGMRWQLGVILVFIALLLWVGWRNMNRLVIKDGWLWILLYSATIYTVITVIYHGSKTMFGEEGSIHIELLLPTFIFGLMMKNKHDSNRRDDAVSDVISIVFMFLVGLGMPLFYGVDFSAVASDSITASQPLMSWGEIAVHVLVVTVLSNVGKMVPMLFYRDRSWHERLALSVGMFTRGEVGAGVIFIALGYGLGGSALVIAVLTIVCNLILTGFFVTFVRRLSMRSGSEPETKGANKGVA